MSPPIESLPPKARRVRVTLSTLLLVALIGAFTVWHTMRSRSAIEALPRHDRRALYDQTLESLETLCRSHDVQFADYCREQATLILRLPECDDACRALAGPFLRATR